MTKKQIHTWDYNDFKISAKTEKEQYAARLFADEISTRTGVATDKVLSLSGKKPSFLLDFDSTITNKDSFIITFDDGTYIIKAQTIRGLIYGYFLFLRKSIFKNNTIALTTDICGTHTPQKALRGHQAGYSPMPNTYDAWDYDQYFRYYLDIMAFGANICEHNGTKPRKNSRNSLMKYEQYEFLQEATRLADYVDIDISLWHANDDDETEEEALALRKWLYPTLKRLDYLFIPGGDPGELKADVFVDRCKKISKILKECHPETQLHPSAQAPHSMPEWGEVFIESIKDEPDEIKAVIMGPNHAFPIHELRAKTPCKYPIRFYPDLTHNLRCEHPVNFLEDDWHFAMASTLSRESVNPRPAEFRTLHRIFSPYSIGSVSYSEGVHDDVNKAVWSALEWDSNADLYEILLDYARLYMPGIDEGKMADTILLLERNWQGDPIENPCIDFSYRNLCELKSDFPEMAENWRFMLLYFRGCCDKLVKMRRTFENKLIKTALPHICNGDTRLAINTLKAPFSDEYTALRSELDDLAAILFKLVGIQLDIEHYCAYGWERGATLETIDNNVTDRAFLLSKLEYAEPMPEPEKERFINALVNRAKVDDDETYYSVALHGLNTLGIRQTGEFYMDIQGDRPYTKETPLPMGMTKVFDHFSFSAKFGGFNPEYDYTLTIVYKGDKNTETQHHKICANGFTVYEGPQFGGSPDPEFDSTLLAPGFESATYLLKKEYFINGTLSLDISEPTEGFKFCEIFIKKNKIK